MSIASRTFTFARDMNRNLNPASSQRKKYVRSEVLTAVVLKIQFFCDVMLGLWVNSIRLFAG
jgi:hypothetical protein